MIGEQEVLYDPKSAFEHARRVIPNLEGELLPGASHDMAVSLYDIVDRRVLGFLKEGSSHPQPVRANG